MNKRLLYVGGLTDTTSDYRLRDLFGAYGIVARTHVVRHKHSGKSAGYGFVEMGSGEQALCAVAMEGALFEGNCLRVFVMPHASACVSSAQPAEGACQ
ncbi:MAG TPA: RNA-binding protein [Nitrospira sp.]|nr:RNA-binding protein [Nitrospira sp.]